MEIIKIKINQLKPYEKNAKIHTPEQIEQIKSSIERFGNNDPIAIWGDKNIIVEGHGRYEALKQLGYTDADCIRLDHLSSEERRAYALAHNKLTMNTGWDIELLDEELESLLDFDMSVFGFNEDDNIIEFPDELEDNREKKGNVIVSINVHSAADWNLIEDEIKRICAEIDASIAVKIE